MLNHALLSIQNLTYSIEGVGKKILNDISLSVEEGDFVILLGSNGCGKSTLLKCINGTYQPDQGAIMFNQHNLSTRSLDELGREIVSMTQDLSGATFGDLTVLENCRCAALKHNQALSKQSAANHLKQFHQKLPQKLRQPAFHLSGGERQCLALAMGLIYQPKLLLLDEHTSALDPEASRQVMALTDQHAKGITVIMTTHNLNDALQYGNRLLMMREGKVIFDVKGDEKQALTKEDLLTFY